MLWIGYGLGIDWVQIGYRYILVLLDVSEVSAPGLTTVQI